MEIPDWLNSDFLSSAVGDRKKQIDVLSYEVTSAVPRGSNYFSKVYRIKVTYRNACSLTEESTSLITKAPLSNGVFQELADKLNTSGREIEMYNTILSQINNRYAPCESLIPKNYFSLREDLLVLEDLSEQGYIMCDRIMQLDNEHCLSVMRALAKFHASSIALHEENPGVIEKAGREILFVNGTELSEYQYKYVKDCFTYTANGLRTVESYRMYAELLLQQVDTVWDKLVKLFAEGKHIKVLNHGDVWTNNILFKHDENGSVTDLKLIDFQMCRYASPGVDIQYFLVTSPNEDVRRNGFGNLLDEYRKTLNDILKTLNHNVQLSAEELEEEVRSAEPFALFVLCDLLPIVMVDPENTPKAVDDKEAPESFDPNVNTFLQVYNNERFLNLIVEHFIRLEESGFFR